MKVVEVWGDEASVGPVVDEGTSPLVPGKLERYLAQMVMLICRLTDWTIRSTLRRPESETKYG